MRMCPKCRGKYPDDFEKCSECNQILIEFSPPKTNKGTKRRDFFAKLEAEMHTNKGRSPSTYYAQNIDSQPKDVEPQKSTPKCPTCSSSNLKKINSLDRTLSFSFWGFGSGKIGKQFECKDCGYKW